MKPEEAGRFVRIEVQVSEVIVVVVGRRTKRAEELGGSEGVAEPRGTRGSDQPGLSIK